MISYENKEIEIKGCPRCAYAKHQFDLPCGIAYENERFILSQDWEVPILDSLQFLLRNILKIRRANKNERDEMFDIVDKTIKTLRENNICDRIIKILGLYLTMPKRILELEMSMNRLTK